MVISPVHEFNLLAVEQGETYIRINSILLRFTRTGEYTLEVTQSPWLLWAGVMDHTSGTMVKTKLV